MDKKNLTKFQKQCSLRKNVKKKGSRFWEPLLPSHFFFLVLGTFSEVVNHVISVSSFPFSFSLTFHFLFIISISYKFKISRIKILFVFSDFLIPNLLVVFKNVWKIHKMFMFIILFALFKNVSCFDIMSNFERHVF